MRNGFEVCFVFARALENYNSESSGNTKVWADRELRHETEELNFVSGTASSRKGFLHAFSIWLLSNSRRTSAPPLSLLWRSGPAWFQLSLFRQLTRHQQARQLRVRFSRNCFLGKPGGLGAGKRPSLTFSCVNAYVLPGGNTQLRTYSYQCVLAYMQRKGFCAKSATSQQGRRGMRGRPSSALRADDQTGESRLPRESRSSARCDTDLTNISCNLFWAQRRASANWTKTR